MRQLTKNAIALALAGAVTASAATPTLARSWKPWAAAGAGFAAGAVVGSAIASRPYYGSYGYYSPGYDSYAYSPGYDGYAYSPSVTYATPAPYYGYGYGYRNGTQGCVSEGPYGKPDYGAC